MWIVTGGAGFIGSALVWKLNQEGIEDILIVDRLGSDEKWKNLRKLRFVDYMEADEFILALEANKLGNVKGIAHLGACSSTTETDAAYLIRNNFEYTKRLALWSARKNKCLVYASSAATYGDGQFGYSADPATTFKLQPLNMYGYSKQLFDLWAFKKGLLKRIVGVKFFNVYGPNESHKKDMRSVVSKAFDQIKQDGKVRLFKSYQPAYAHGDQERDFLYVKDAVNVFYDFMTQSKYKGLYNLGSGKARTWKDLVSAIFTALGKPPKIEFIDMPESLRATYQYHTQADMRWRTGKGAVPFATLEEGVRDYVQNYLTKTDSYL